MIPECIIVYIQFLQGINLKRNILILEDNEDCIMIYNDNLSLEFNLTITHNLSEFEKFLKTRPEIDLILADLNLPDGFFLEWIMNQGELLQDTPTIIISSSEDLNILTSCFEWGATDYIIKPFKRNDLKVKISKALGKFSIVSNSSGDEISEICDELTSIESKVFRILFEQYGKFVSKDTLIQLVWKKVVVHQKTLNVHLYNLRRKISHTAWTIENEENRGWKLSKKDS